MSCKKSCSQRVSIYPQKKEGQANISKFLDILWPGRAEHQCLTIGTNLADNFANLRFKPHIKHAVGFVHNQVGYSTQVSLLSLQHVNQTSGGSDNYLNATLQVSDLWAFWCTTVNCGVANSRIRSELGALLLDLYSEFASGGKY